MCRAEVQQAADRAVDAPLHTSHTQAHAPSRQCRSARLFLDHSLLALHIKGTEVIIDPVGAFAVYSWLLHMHGYNMQPESGKE